MNKTKIFLDTDIGDDIDDAFALSLILNSNEFELLGVSTVYKNTYLRSKIAEYMIMKSNTNNVKVCCGFDNPINEEIKQFSYEQRGNDGKILIAHYLPEMENMPIYQDGVDLLLEKIKQNPNEVILIAIGPLTNIAKAIQKDFRTFSLLKEIRIMGGSVFDSRCEWNFVCDSEAASIVFNSGVPIVMYGLDVTGICELTNEDIKYFSELKNNEKEALAKMMKIWIHNKNGKKPLLHDALVVACMIEECCNYINIPVEIDNNERKGFTNIICEKKCKRPTAKVAIQVDTRKFINLIKSRIKD